MKISGLAAGTSYEFKAADFVKSKDKNGKVKTIKGNDSKVTVFRTAYKSVPAIKSVKTSKVTQKTKKFKGQYVKSGIHMKWVGPSTMKVTTFKLTVNFKSKLANAGGIIVIDPDGVWHIVSGSKNKYEFSGEIKEYKKGKKLTFKIATYANGGKVDNSTGISPYKKVRVTMK